MTDLQEEEEYPFGPIPSAGIYARAIPEEAISIERYDVGARAHMTQYPPLPLVEESMFNTAAAYNTLVDATCKLHMKQTELHEAKEQLAEKQAQIRYRTDPKELGSNEAQREAAIATRCDTESRQVNLLERIILSLRGEVEAASIRCKLCDLTLAHIKIAHQDKLSEERE